MLLLSLWMDAVALFSSLGCKSQPRLTPARPVLFPLCHHQLLPSTRGNPRGSWTLGWSFLLSSQLGGVHSVEESNHDTEGSARNAQGTVRSCRTLASACPAPPRTCPKPAVDEHKVSSVSTAGQAHDGGRRRASKPFLPRAEQASSRTTAPEPASS